MEAPIINTTNFFEPTEKYSAELKEHFPESDIKLWFNADLLQWMNYFKSVNVYDKVQLNDAYRNFCEHYEVKITGEELLEKFGEYSQDEFTTLVRYLIHNTPKLQNDTNRQV